MAFCHCGLPLQHDLMKLSEGRTTACQPTSRSTIHTYCIYKCMCTIKKHNADGLSKTVPSLSLIRTQNQNAKAHMSTRKVLARAETGRDEDSSTSSTFREIRTHCRPPHWEKRWVPVIRLLHQAIQVLSEQFAGDPTKQSTTVISTEAAVWKSTQTNVMNGV